MILFLCGPGPYSQYVPKRDRPMGMQPSLWRGNLGACYMEETHLGTQSKDMHSQQGAMDFAK